MKLYLDQPAGHEFDSGIGEGRISRIALAVADPSELPAGRVADPNAVVRILGMLGLPQKGEPYPHPDYQDYFLKRHILRSFNALHTGIEMVYEWHGLMTAQDSSTLSNVPTNLHPKDFTPLYIKVPGGVDPRPVEMQALLPLRHLVVSKTISYEANVNVLNAFGSVNQLPWMGLPKGYWLYSGLEAQSVDDGITYTYSVTFTTKQKEDWSQVAFLQDPDTGYPFYVAPAAVKALRAKPYDYAIDDSVNYLLKVGMHPMADFFQIFGI